MLALVKHHLGLGVDDAHFGKTTYHNLDVAALGINLVGAYGAELVNFENTFVARCNRVDSRDV